MPYTLLPFLFITFTVTSTSASTIGTMGEKIEALLLLAELSLSFPLPRLFALAVADGTGGAVAARAESGRLPSVSTSLDVRVVVESRSAIWS